MALGKNKKIVNLVQSISEMKEENYAAGSPELQNVYNRLNDGRHQLAQVYGEDMQAVMAMSDLGLKVGHDTVKMTTAAEDVAASTKTIHDATAETSSIAEEVRNAHEGLPNTIIDVSEKTTDFYKKIEIGQQELTSIRDLSKEAISELAEGTKQLTGNMGEFVEGIRDASEKSSKSVDVAITSLDNIDQKINAVWNINDENKKNVGNISESISSLAGISEEISSSMNVLETQVSCIEDQCSNLSNDAETLTIINGNLKGSVEPITQVETGMDHAVKIVGGMNRDTFYRMDNATFDTYVQKAMEAHKNWLETLHTMVTEKTVLPLQLDDTKCGFGHFYYSMHPENPAIAPVWNALAEKHRRFHGYGKEVQQALFDENVARAEEIYQEAENYSNELQNDFPAILNISAGLSQNGQSVFA